MKAYIGPYKKWWSTYEIASLIPFTSDEQQEKIGNFLYKTWLTNICNWINKLSGERKIKIRIDKYDTWSMDNTLAMIILPMLKQLKKTKQGSALVDDEDLPVYMRHTFSNGPDDCETDDRWVHYKWEWVLNEIIWAFENELDDSWEDQFVHGEPKYEFNNNFWKDTEYSQMIQTNPDYWVDREAIKEYDARIKNGFRLFGKYYRGLWD